MGNDTERAITRTKAIVNAASAVSSSTFIVANMKRSRIEKRFPVHFCYIFASVVMFNSSSSS